jgi:hypothetical protein
MQTACMSLWWSHRLILYIYYVCHSDSLPECAVDLVKIKLNQVLNTSGTAVMSSLQPCRTFPKSVRTFPIPCRMFPKPCRMFPKISQAGGRALSLPAEGELPLDAHSLLPTQASAAENDHDRDYDDDDILSVCMSPNPPPSLSPHMAMKCAHEASGRAHVARLKSMGVSGSLSYIGNCYVNLTECSLKLTECSLKLTECSLKLTECSMMWGVPVIMLCYISFFSSVWRSDLTSGTMMMMMIIIAATEKIKRWEVKKWSHKHIWEHSASSSIIQWTFGIIQGTFGIIQGTSGMVMKMMIEATEKMKRREGKRRSHKRIWERTAHCWLTSSSYVDWRWLTLIDVDWRWLTSSSYVDWRWLTLIDVDWRWLTLIDVDWRWLTLIDVFFLRWWTLIDVDWRWLTLIDVDWRLLHTLIDVDWRWLTLIDVDWRWLTLIDVDWRLLLTLIDVDWRWLTSSSYVDWRWLTSSSYVDWRLLLTFINASVVYIVYCTERGQMILLNLSRKIGRKDTEL